MLNSSEIDMKSVCLDAEGLFLVTRIDTQDFNVTANEQMTWQNVLLKSKTCQEGWRFEWGVTHLSPRRVCVLLEIRHHN